MKKKTKTKEQLEAWVANVNKYRTVVLGQWVADVEAFIANMEANPDDAGSNPPPDPPPAPHH